MMMIIIIMMMMMTMMMISQILLNCFHIHNIVIARPDMYKTEQRTCIFDDDDDDDDDDITNTTAPFSHTQYCNSWARHVQNRTKNMNFCNSDENHVHKLGGYDV